MPDRTARPFSTRLVGTSAGRLQILTNGTSGGTAIVFLHGGGSDCSRISWPLAMEALSGRADLVAVDLPGFGGSIDAEPLGSPKAMADLVAEVMDRLAIAGAVIFGVSMGGDVALNLALRHPENVEGLVLVAPGGLVPILRNRAAQFAAWLTARLPDAILLPTIRAGNRASTAVLRRMVRDLDALPAGMVETYREEASHPKAGIAYARYNQATLGRRAMLNDLTDEVSAIAVPTLFFHGEDDPLVPPSGSIEAARRMRDATLVLVPDCGHWAQQERPDAFLAAASAHLDRIEATEKVQKRGIE